MRTIVASVCVLGAALLACKSESSGNITVNGAAFDIAECRSGEANSPPFSGVAFLDSGGNQVRFVGKPAGGFTLYHFTKGQGIGTLVGEDCGSLTVNKTNTKINNIANIEGTVSANCTGSGLTVIANVNYAKCH